LNWDIALLVTIDFLLTVLWAAVFIYCAKYVIRNFKKRETEQEKLVRESKEFMLGLRD
jgi:predicted membrane protein